MSPVCAELSTDNRWCNYALLRFRLFCDRRSVGQSVLMSGLHLRPMTRFVLLSGICSLHVVGRPPWREDGSVILSYNLILLPGPSPSELMTTPCCLVWDFPNLEGQVPVFISPRNRVAQLYPRALGSLFVASYDSQDYGGGILTRLNTGRLILMRCIIAISLLYCDMTAESQNSE
jgi:hypothetical protein